MAARHPDRRLSDRHGPIPARGHALLPHTADVAISAHGPDPASVLEEAALALSELTVDLGQAPGRPRSRPPTRAAIELAARDLVALAYAWLNELVGRIDVDGALVDVTVERVEPLESGWRLRAAIATEPFDGRRVRRRSDVKSATYHGLVVESDGDGWTMTAVLDV